jgi:ATPase subunit of ABC transporter with duplicated ATPase domains
MDELALRLEREPKLAERHAAALERFLLLGGGDLDARSGTVCAEVGLNAALDEPLGALSGGEVARAQLAAVLLARFDVFLLDEPTNDLDFAGLDRLERFVRNLRGSVVVVSHDRDFLDRTVERVVELDEWTHHAREFAGGWSEYEQARANQLRRQTEAYGAYEGEKARLEEQLRRMQQWEERGYGQGRKKKKTKDVKKQAAKKVAQLERVEKPWTPWELRLSLSPAARGGDVVARLEQAVVERGGFRVGPVDLELHHGDRLALLGRNGSGKTTLLQALLGELSLASGRRSLGPGTVLGALAQGPGPFASEERLLDRFVALGGLSQSEARSLLATFALRADDVMRPGRSLSPGERSRAAIALLAARGVNALVLDEPTNNLDLEAIEQLELALGSYEGAAVLVTHDRRFLEAFAATQTLELPPSPAASRLP